MSGTGADTPQERFQRALVQSTRALAGREDLEVQFGPQGPHLAGNRITLPPVPTPLSAPAASRLRGHADRLALRIAYHDAALHSRLRPDGPRARELYDALEDVRCQALGSAVLEGVCGNLTAMLLDTLQRKGVRPGQPGNPTTAEALALIAREQLTGRALPALAAEHIARARADLAPRAARTLSMLAEAMHDQARYAGLVHDLARDIGIGHEIGEASTRRREPRKPDAPPDAAPRPEESATPLAVKAQRGELEEDAPPLEDDEPPAQRDTTEAKQERKEDTRDRGARMARLAPVDDSDDPNRHYRIFTRAHDEVVKAGELADAAELDALRARLDEQSQAVRLAVGRLAQRLERLLRARQLRGWSFDVDEGVLDAARLSRVIVDPLSALPYKTEDEIDFKDTVVGILLDNSGSMRGRPILVAALCADILARTLERCQVKVEILGFTTREWKGGRSREDWLAAGHPSGCGRISDLRYIIYKPADEPWRRVRRNLGLMLREDLLKENVDGEALLWAHERLLCRSEQRRILMVISDGVPLDEATLSANPGGYLEQHLRNVIRWIEKHSTVELAAIGIGHDVTDFYARAVAITQVDQLAGAMIEQLAELFVAPPRRTQECGRGRV
ncbi:MAG: hypothetical protein U1F35_06315 [Steroidobacteraceae bacterium]